LILRLHLEQRERHRSLPRHFPIAENRRRGEFRTSSHIGCRAFRKRATDDADLVERIGATVPIVAGSPLNLKITTADDLGLAEAIAASRPLA